VEEADSSKVEQGGQIKGGLLAPAAAAIVGKVTYVARTARPDLLRACSEGTVGDRLEELKLVCHCDSDYAGDDGESFRSTSGGWLELVGPQTCFPLTFSSKRQTSVSRSWYEAEAAAADVMVRKKLLPLSCLVDSG